MSFGGPAAERHRGRIFSIGCPILIAATMVASVVFTIRNPDQTPRFQFGIPVLTLYAIIFALPVWLGIRNWQRRGE